MFDAPYLYTVLTHVSWENDNGADMRLPKVFDHEKEIENKDIF